MQNDRTLLFESHLHKVAFYGCFLKCKSERALALQWMEKLLKAHPCWSNTHFYIDHVTFETCGAFSPAFLRLLKDAQAHKFDLLVLPSISHFTQYLVNILSLVAIFQQLDIQIYFEKEDLWSLDENFSIYLSLKFTQIYNTSHNVACAILECEENGKLHDKERLYNLLPWMEKLDHLGLLNPCLLPAARNSLSEYVKDAK